MRPPSLKTTTPPPMVCRDPFHLSTPWLTEISGQTGATSKSRHPRRDSMPVSTTGSPQLDAALAQCTTPVRLAATLAHFRVTPIEIAATLAHLGGTPAQVAEIFAQIGMTPAQTAASMALFGVMPAPRGPQMTTPNVPMRVQHESPAPTLMPGYASTPTTPIAYSAVSPSQSIR